MHAYNEFADEALEANPAVRRFETTFVKRRVKATLAFPLGAAPERNLARYSWNRSAWVPARTKTIAPPFRPHHPLCRSAGSRRRRGIRDSRTTPLSAGGPSIPGQAAHRWHEQQHRLLETVHVVSARPCEPLPILAEDLRIFNVPGEGSSLTAHAGF
jgi:hypothetical protein